MCAAEVINEKKLGSFSGWRDWIGISASVLCAIHCAAMPFVILALPMLGLSFLADESFHQWMAVFCLVIALTAFVPGWRKHRKLLPGLIALSGLSLITTAAFGMSDACCSHCEQTSEASSPACDSTDCKHCLKPVPSEEPQSASSQRIAGLGFDLARVAVWLTPVGGLLLIWGHWINRRFTCRCGCCPAPEAS